MIREPIAQLYLQVKFFENDSSFEAKKVTNTIRDSLSKIFFKSLWY